MRRSVPIQVVVHGPGTEAGRAELARCAAGVHAEFILQTIRRLDCPAAQKQALLRAVMEALSTGRSSA